MSTCAWLEDHNICLIETVLDQDEYIYCEYVDGDMTECSRYKEYNED